MNSMNSKIISLLFSFFFVSSLYASEVEHFFVVSGVVINSGNSKKIENFIQMLEDKSGYKLKPYYVRSYEHLSQVLQDNPDALAWTCGAPYVEDAIKDGQQLIAVPLYKGVPTYSSFIVSRKSDPGKSILDFKSKIFTYSDPRSNSGFVAPASELQKHGYKIGTFFSVEIYAGIHEKSIEAIYRGLADVAAIDEYVWIEYTKTHPHLKEQLHVIQKIGPYAFTPIVAGKDVDKKTIKKLQEALVGMSKVELQTFKNDFNMDGFVIKDKTFFQSIKTNMLVVGIDLEVEK
ncbi:PhnD/SsuA/transferrin family substrate-binding protein [Sulfurimonas sp. SAG-AH-194-C21]|nr:PhnD/SsuA/transferrin family substrate-binding protein [Sulfurimonas sp. SAG-AH-194-C21]MDF1882992.1 PhnD/SsuA/transferrin family substrate-binding protein [Sulfurimonas sp. SAG-AH-194-C21]